MNKSLRNLINNVDKNNILPTKRKNTFAVFLHKLQRLNEPQDFVYGSPDR